MRLYLDANVLIYAVEGPPDLGTQVLDWIDKAEAADGMAFTSRLSRLECRVKPLRTGDTDTLERFEAVLDASNLQLVDVTEAVIELATDLRAREGFRTVDAIHLATAVLVHAEAFLTADARLQRFDRLRVALIESRKIDPFGPQRSPDGAEVGRRASRRPMRRERATRERHRAW